MTEIDKKTALNMLKLIIRGEEGLSTRCECVGIEEEDYYYPLQSIEEYCSRLDIEFDDNQDNYQDIDEMYREHYNKIYNTLENIILKE